MGWAQRMPGGDEASWRVHFENIRALRVLCVHHNLFSIDINNEAAIRRGNIDGFCIPNIMVSVFSGMEVLFYMI